MGDNYSAKLLEKLETLAKKHGILLRQTFNLGIKTSQDKFAYGNKWEKQSGVFTEREKETLGKILLPEDFETKKGEKAPTSIMSKLARRVRAEKKKDYTIADMPDLIRTTAIVENNAHIPYFMNMLKHDFPDLKGERPDYPMRGYKGTHTSHLVGGIAADTQIVSPLQGMVDDFTHDLYDIIRELPPNSPDRKQLEAISKYVYDTLFESTGFLDNDIAIRSMILDYGRGSAENDPQVVQKFKKAPYSEKKGDVSFDLPRLVDQAREARELSVDKQVSLTKRDRDIFNHYIQQRRQGQIPADNKANGQTSDSTQVLTKRQKLIYSRFEKSIKSHKSKLDKLTPGTSDTIFNEHYGTIMKNIEDKEIIPWIDKRTEKGK